MSKVVTGSSSAGEAANSDDEEKTKKIEYLKGEIKSHLNTYEDKLKYNLNKSTRNHHLTTLLGAIITILSGLNIKYLFKDLGVEFSDISRVVILIIGAVITVLSASKGFYNNKELWVIFRMGSNQLKEVRSDLNYYLEGKPIQNVSLSVLDSYKRKVQSIVNNVNKQWESLRSN